MSESGFFNEKYQYLHLDYFHSRNLALFNIEILAHEDQEFFTEESQTHNDGCSQRHIFVPCLNFNSDISVPIKQYFIQNNITIKALNRTC